MTKRILQRDLIFDFICEFKRIHHGTSPTYAEIAREFTIAPESARSHCGWLAAEQRIQIVNGIGIIVPQSEWELIESE